MTYLPEGATGVKPKKGSSRAKPNGQDPTASTTPNGRRLPAPGNPMGCARAMVASEFAHPEHSLIVQQGGQFYSWDGTCWPPMDDKEVRTRAYKFAERATYVHVPPTGKPEVRAWHPTQRKVADFVDALRAVAHIPSTTRAPTWLAEAEYEASDVISCANGLVHIPTRTLLPHTPLFYTHHAVPYAFDPEAQTPEAWLSFLHSIWGSDQQSIDTLQEEFGYLLTGDTSLQKLFLHVGPKRGGKGTIAHVLKGLLGEHNVAGPTMSSLATNFGLAPLVGKSAAVIPDARIGGSDTSIVAERLLSISGEDVLTIDRKYQEPVTMQLPTRILILSNELPRMSDASGALASRFIILVMSKSFYGREDTTLRQRLLQELPAIFNWALDGADRLRERGRFEMPESSKDALRELEDLGSPINAFVRDKCAIGPEHEIPVDLLYEDWKTWSTENGRKVASKQSFGRDLKAAYPGIRTTQPRTEEGSRFRMYQGIGRRS